MAAIAEEAGVTKPTLYREVGAKDALVHALGARLDGRVRTVIETAVGAVSGRRNELRTFVRSSLEAVGADRDIYLFVSAGGTGEDRLRQALLLADRTADLLAQRLAEQRVADDADPSVATAWAYGLVGMLHFVTLWWLRAPTVTADELADQLTELLWSGLQVDEAPAANARRRRGQR